MMRNANRYVICLWGFFFLICGVKSCMPCNNWQSWCFGHFLSSVLYDLSLMDFHRLYHSPNARSPRQYYVSLFASLGSIITMTIYAHITTTPADNVCKVMGRVASVILKKLHLDLTSDTLKPVSSGLWYFETYFVHFYDFCCAGCQQPDCIGPRAGWGGENICKQRCCQSSSIAGYRERQGATADFTACSCLSFNWPPRSGSVFI